MNQPIETGICCFQLHDDSCIPTKWYRSISKLIYETDPFIYPALFGRGKEGEKTATIVLPSVFETNEDAMFSKRNLFVATINEELVGLILWHKGPLCWDERIIEQCATRLGVELIKNNLAQVAREYVADRYLEANDVEEKSLYLINVCVTKEKRGFGIAKTMLRSFIQCNCTEIMELAVLADNKPAIGLYRKFGFQVVQRTAGFSLDAQKPSCLIMSRQVFFT